MLGVMRLENSIRRYAWGSRTALARLQGRRPAAEPEAELWLGAHPQLPSAVMLAGRRVCLDRLVAERPAETLGPVAQRFGAALPFLLKVLAVAEPLSIQAHPTLAQAAAGFAREEAAGIPADAPQRSYRDRNHKPEVVVALEPYWLLGGFRPYAEVARSLAAIGVPALRATVTDLRAKPGAEALRALMDATLRLDAEQRTDLVARAVAVAGSRLQESAPTAAGSRVAADSALAAAAARWVQRLAAQYPDDSGLLSPWLLNLVHLAPGEALFTGAGTLHALLRGTAVELQANSDNVLRGGLTPKYVDVPELLRVASFVPHEPVVLRPPPAANGERRYPTPAAEFALSSVALDKLEPGTGFAATTGGPEILLLLHGHGTVRDAAGREVACRPGESVFVPAAVASYQVRGTALMFRARVPQPGR